MTTALILWGELCPVTTHLTQLSWFYCPVDIDVWIRGVYTVDALCLYCSVVIIVCIMIICIRLCELYPTYFEIGYLSCGHLLVYDILQKRFQWIT